MSRNITVTFANGAKAEYRNTPDNVTPEQVAERAQQEYGLQVSEIDGGGKSGVMDTLTRGAKVIGSAAVRGAAALPALIGDGANAIAENLPLVGPTLKYARGQAGLPETNGMTLSSAVSKFGTKPETTGEKYLASGVEGVAGALAGPGGLISPVKNAVVGLAAGLGGEAGGQLSGGSMLGRLAGAVAGGGVAGVTAGAASRIRPQSSDLAREALEGIEPSVLKAAQAMQVRAKASGVNMDLAQALEAVGAPASNLATLRNVLANSRHGSATQAVLRNQPKELELLSDVTVGGLPGPQWGAGSGCECRARGSYEECARG